ncbi:MAG TPA: tetratricopeptide repeat protein [Terriglobales bacterium]|nr:tetratricopeptide repeat protein [Terriglobales bacterium]
MLLILSASLPAQEQPAAGESSAEEHLAAAREFRQKIEWQKALVEYQEAVRLAPESAEAHAGLGWALSWKGDIDAAMGEEREALRLDPNLADAHYGLAWCLNQKEDHDAAIREYQEALRLKPDMVKAHYNLGIAYAEKKDFDNAIASCREAIRLKPSDADAHGALAWVLSAKGDTANSEREYREAIRLKPDDLDNRFNLAILLDNNGQPDAALREYREAVRIKPESGEAHAHLADALRERGETKVAMSEYQRAIELDPSDSGSHINLGSILFQQKDIEGSIREFREALRLKPGDPDAHLDLGLALEKRGAAGDQDASVAEFREAIRLKPNLAKAHYNLGQALERARDFDGALEEYKLAVQSDPKVSVYQMHYSRLEGERDLHRLLPGNWSHPMLVAFTMSCALVPSFLLLGYFRARDLYPEPARVLWATFALGIAIIPPVLFIDGMLEPLVRLFKTPIGYGFADGLFNAAIPEELMKFVVVVFYCSRHKEFDEPMDGIVYGAVASLGFATFENLSYVADRGFWNAVWRAVTAVPGHAFDGAIMGYFVGQWRFSSPRRAGLLWKGYIIPVLMHWIYDAPLLASMAAGKLTGAERAAALKSIGPLTFIPVLVLAGQAVWTVKLVNRLRREQVQITKDSAAAAAASLGAADLVAIVKAPDKPPSAGLGWAMSFAGGTVALFGSFVSLAIVITFIQRHAAGDEAFGNVFGASVIGAIPLLIGFTLFVLGVKRVHANRRLKSAQVAAAASAAAAAASAS